MQQQDAPAKHVLLSDHDSQLQQQQQIDLKYKFHSSSTQHQKNAKKLHLNQQDALKLSEELQQYQNYIQPHSNENMGVDAARMVDGGPYPYL